MLEKLIIKNVALIESVEIDFKNGLNVLSGETGAGKSVILESLNFALGAKADRSLIRSGASECFVSAIFSVDNNAAIKQEYEENGFDYDELLIISRKFSVDGKSTVRLNGEIVSTSLLKKFTSLLVDVHGQSEHFSLLKASNQLKLLDLFGGNEIKTVKAKVSSLFSEYKKNINELEKLGGDEGQRLLRLDILNYQIKEIQDADLKSGEEPELLAIRQNLLYAERISNALTAVKEALNGENGTNDILSALIKNTAQISGLGEEYSKLNQRINDVYAECSDISDTASELLDNMDSSSYNLEEVEERLDVIKSLKRKYGAKTEEINEFLEKAIAERERLLNWGEIAAELIKNKEKLEKELYENYVLLRSVRKKYAEDFSSKVKNELLSLGMPNAEFVIDFGNDIAFEQCKFDSQNGIDTPEFFFSANLGEPVKPLSQIISGGEMSRFMLAIKAQTAVYNDIGTFIFDEIDAGISGRTAGVVAEKFIAISKKVQVIAITHLPQISAAADNNLLIEKEETAEKTVTTVVRLDEAGKLSEIIRLVGGDEMSDSAIKHAKEMIEKAKAFK